MLPLHNACLHQWLYAVPGGPRHILRYLPPMLLLYLTDLVLPLSLLSDLFLRCHLGDNQTASVFCHQRTGGGSEADAFEHGIVRLSLFGILAQEITRLEMTNRLGRRTPSGNRPPKVLFF